MAKRERKHPENLKDSGAVDATTELEDYVTTLAKDVESERGNRTTWEHNIKNAVRLRYGIRRPKVNPWKGCANFSVPLIDTHINNNKPAYINLLNADPICIYTPFSSEFVEPARKRELLLDWRIKSKMRFFEPYCYGVDMVLEQGATVFKTIWKFETANYTEQINIDDFDEDTIGALFDPRVTDKMLMKVLEEEYGIDMGYEENYQAVLDGVMKFREGKTEFDLDLVETKSNQPEVLALSLLDDVVIPINTENIQDAMFVDHTFYKSVNSIRIDMETEKYTKYTEEQVRNWAGKRKYDDKNRTFSVSEDSNVLLHEVACWYDINGDGIDERCIVTYPDNAPTDILRFIEVPYEHGMFPYELVKRELNDRNAYSSRGYSFLDEDYQVGISKALNQAIDNGDIVNSPKIVYKKNSIANIKNTRYTPAEPVEIINGNVSDYEIRQVGNASQGILFQQAQFLKSWADQRIGNVMSAITDPTNQAGGGMQGQKTKAEIQAVQGMSQSSISFDLLVWQMQMAGVYYQIDSLYEQFGDDEEEVIITGEPSVNINRREIQGKFHIMPNGRLENTDPQMRAMKTYNLMKVFAGDEDIDQLELKKLYLMDYDPRIAKKIILSPEEMEQRDQMKQKIVAQQKTEANEQAIGMAKMKNLLEVNKKQMLAEIPNRQIIEELESGTDNKKIKRKTTTEYGKV